MTKIYILIFLGFSVLWTIGWLSYFIYDFFIKL